MTSVYRKVLALALAIVGLPLSAQETFHGNFAEPADGGNLDVVRSHFDGTVAYLVPRWHESEALGLGSGARRWRNLLFAIRGVRGKVVNFHLPARPPESGVLVHNMDSATLNLLEPVWSYDSGGGNWKAFTSIDVMKPDAADSVGATFPLDAIVDNSGGVVLTSGSPRRDDYGWVFRNTTPFTEDVVYISINEHYPVGAFYSWLQQEVFTHPWVTATASEQEAGTFRIGYQSGVGRNDAVNRDVPNTPLYAFQIKDPAANPTKVVMLVSGQHPYEGQTKAALEGAVRWILDPNDPAAAAYRAEYITLVYPLVNPTGELAGLWRGTAAEPRRDINRNWNTARTDPLSDRGIDTVIIHKQAMLADVAHLALGQPYAVVDLHQNYGDQLPSLHYVLHNTNALATAWMQRLSERVKDMADIVSNSTSSQTLRGFWQFAGAGMTLCIERSTYSTLAAERDFGREMMRTFAPDLLPPAPSPAIASTPVDLAPPSTGSAAVGALPSVERHLADAFIGIGDLDRRPLQVDTVGGARWAVELGQVNVIGEGASAGEAVARALVDAGSVDATVQADITLQTSNSSAGLVFRAQDRDNFYYFRLHASGWQVGRVLANTATALASDNRNVPAGIAHTLRVDVVGNEAIFHINGQRVHQQTVLSEPAATRFGFASGMPAGFSIGNFQLKTNHALPVASEGGGVVALDAAAPAAAPVRVHDEFVGEGTLAGRRPNGAMIGGPVWDLALGAIEMVDGVALAAPGHTARALLDAGAGDARVRTQIRLDSENALAGLVLRATDRDNFHFFRLQKGGWVFGQVIQNTAYTLARGRGSFAPGGTYAIEAECRGSSAVFRVDGQLVYTAMVEPSPRATGFGLGSGSPYSFAAYDFQIDAGAIGSIGAEGAAAEPVVAPTTPPRRLLGPAGRRSGGAVRILSLSTARSATVDQPI